MKPLMGWIWLSQLAWIYASLKVQQENVLRSGTWAVHLLISNLQPDFLLVCFQQLKVIYVCYLSFLLPTTPQTLLFLSSCACLATFIVDLQLLSREGNAVSHAWYRFLISQMFFALLLPLSLLSLSSLIPHWQCHFLDRSLNEKGWISAYL